MEYRKGTCASCGAEYKLPPAFAGDKAKCKKCEGVVEVGSVTREEPPRQQPRPEPVPTKRPAAAKAPAQAPPKKVVEAGEEAPRKRREGPSMKEQLLARRQAEEAAASEAPKAPAARKAAAKPAAGKARASAKPAGKAAAKPTATKAAPKKASASKGASTRSASRRRGGDDGEERPARGGRRGKQKESNPMMLIGSVLALVVAAAGWYFLMGPGKGEDPQTDDQSAQVSPEAGGTDAATSPETGTDEGMGESTPAAEEATPAETTPAPADEDPTPADEPEDEPAADEPEGPASEAPRNAATGRYKVFMLSRQPKGGAKYPDELYDPKDPAEPQIATYEPFTAPPGTSPADWEEIMDLARTMIDPDAGAAGNRAAIALEKMGKPAFPALINVMLTLDFSTKEGNQAGDVVQRSLQNIANGRNVGWYHDYNEEPNKTAIQNARCVDLLYEKVWQRELNEPGYFERYAKLNETDKPAEEAAPAADDGALDDALDALDDL